MKQLEELLQELTQANLVTEEKRSVLAECMKKYNKEHKDEISKKKKEYYIKNKEKFLAKAKEYSLAHKTERNLKNKIERFIKKIGKFEEYKNLTTKEKIIFREKIILEYN